MATDDSLVESREKTGQLTEHFSLEELTHSDTANARGIDNEPPPEILANLVKTAELLEEVRRLLGGPITVTSGYRSPALNAAVGGVTKSAHLTGQAADFGCPGFGDPLKVCHAIAASSIAFDQLIHEWVGGAHWVHIAWRDDPRRELLTIDSQGTRPGLW